MKVVLLISSFLLAHAAAIDLSAPVVLEVDGRIRTFEIACDELHCEPTDGSEHGVPIAEVEDGIAAAGAAEDLEATGAGRFDLVIYEQGKPREVRYRRVVGRQILVTMDGSVEAATIFAESGAVLSKIPSYSPTHLILTFGGIGDSLTKLDAVRALDGVAAAEPLLGRQKIKRLLPNDPKFYYSGAQPNYQWHLRNTGQNGSPSGHDVNVTSTWNNYLGTGVTIAIIDDGLQVGHPDLSPNANTAIDHDWNDSSPSDPTPGNTVDDHGTSCAGVAAARGDNGIGVSGAAPRASLVGLRLIAGSTTYAEDAAALTWRDDIVDISSNSWGESDYGDDLYPLNSLIAAAFADGVSNGRGGKGTIYVWAAGNGRYIEGGQELGDYSNYEGYNNARETISVGAVDFTRNQSYYSESGANVLVSAPSSGSAAPSITTTTLTALGSYTDSFGGTSSATPLASGCIALMLEANPNLGWRDVQEILVRSSEKVDPGDSGWSNNGAGFHFHHGYGAGMIDANASVTMAKTWQNLGNQASTTKTLSNVNAAIPDNSSSGVTRSITFTGDPLRVEHVRLSVEIDHTYRGDLAVQLISPDGTVSHFAHPHFDGNFDMDHTFLSVRHWGEESTGTWSVKVSDRFAGDIGTVRKLTLDLHGSYPITLSGYDLWADGKFDKDQLEDPAISGMTGDPDGDGRPNLYEYGVGGEPLTSDRVGEPIFYESNNGTYKLRYVADTSKEDLTYRARYGSVFGNWLNGTESVVSTSGSLQTREITLFSADARWARLDITR